MNQYEFDFSIQFIVKYMNAYTIGLQNAEYAMLNQHVYYKWI
jgi:hypothetical protein